MAVSKLWPVKTNLAYVIDYASDKAKTDKTLYSSRSYQSLQDVLAYAENEEKTEQLLFVQGINCNPLCARDEFIMVKQQYGKTGGIQAYHGYLSFKEQNISPEQAMQIGMEFAREVWGKRFQVVVSTHLNTQHLHCHFVINSVSFKDGLRAHDETSWFRFSPVADRICKKHGLHVVKDADRNQTKSYYKELDAAGEPTPWNLARMAIDEAVSKSKSHAQLVSELGKMGYEFNFNEAHKYWTITPKGRQKAIRLYRLGPEYTPENILAKLAANNEKSGSKPSVRAVLLQPRYSPPASARRTVYRRTRSTIKRILGLKVHTGLSGMYLYYMFKLGKLPVTKCCEPMKVHYAIRDDLLKLEAITAQTRLLCSNNIGSFQELQSFKASLNEKISSLSDERRTLRNILRRVNTNESQKEEIKKQIDEIGGQLKGLRRDIKNCDEIAERSGIISEKLRQVREDEKQQRKEEREYGNIR